MNLDFKKELSNVDIQNICDKLGIKINRICMKDELAQQKLKNGNYIINLENHNQSGSHWCCFKKLNKCIYYFDAFGIMPPQNEIDLFKENHDKLSYNDLDIQDINSILCGYYCIGFFLYIQHNYNKSISLDDCCESYIEMFSQNTKLNDNILKKFIMKYYYRNK